MVPYPSINDPQPPMPIYRRPKCLIGLLLTSSGFSREQFNHFITFVGLIHQATWTQNLCLVVFRDEMCTYQCHYELLLRGHLPSIGMVCA